jgi:hypothetical protein
MQFGAVGHVASFVSATDITEIESVMVVSKSLYAKTGMAPGEYADITGNSLQSFEGDSSFR